MKGFKDLKLAFILFIMCTAAIFAQGGGTTKFKVVLDPGHGGKDYGANWHGYIEKNIALNVVLKVGKLLEKEDTQVIYTRKTDVFVELDERANIANKADANLFVSIHCNAETKKTAFGAETFFIGTSKNASNLEVAKKENDVINLEENSKEKYRGYDPNKPESFIGITLGQEQNIAQAITLARKIQDCFKDDNNRKDRGVKPAPFLVLHKTAMPSVLVELGFISYKEEGQWLNSDAGQDQMAASIAKAIIQYKKEFFNSGSTDAATTEPVKEDKPVVNTPEPETPKTTPPAVANEAKGVVYKVQISAVGRDVELTPSNFKGLDQLSKDKSTSVIKYFYGNTPSLEKARELLEVAKSKGFTSAFIVPFKDGKKITMQEALKK